MLLSMLPIASRSRSHWDKATVPHVSIKLINTISVLYNDVRVIHLKINAILQLMIQVISCWRRARQANTKHMRYMNTTDIRSNGGNM